MSLTIILAARSKAGKAYELGWKPKTTGLFKSIDAEHDAVIEEGKDQAPKVHFDEMYSLGIVSKPVRFDFLFIEVELTIHFRSLGFIEIRWQKMGLKRIRKSQTRILSDILRTSQRNFSVREYTFNTFNITHINGK